jgi:CP family cyanate transporter-like MFS transporter
VLLLVVFVVVCVNLRVAFADVGPLIPVMDLDRVTVTVLTTLPPLCLGLFAPLGAWARSRIGEERGLFVAMIVLTAGLLIRSTNMAGLIAGTVVASVAIAVMNVVTPVLVRKRFAPNRDRWQPLRELLAESGRRSRTSTKPAACMTCARGMSNP